MSFTYEEDIDLIYEVIIVMNKAYFPVGIFDSQTNFRGISTGDYLSQKKRNIFHRVVVILWTWTLHFRISRAVAFTGFRQSVSSEVYR